MIQVGLQQPGHRRWQYRWRGTNRTKPHFWWWRTCYGLPPKAHVLDLGPQCGGFEVVETLEDNLWCLHPHKPINAASRQWVLWLKRLSFYKTSHFPIIHTHAHTKLVPFLLLHLPWPMWGPHKGPVATRLMRQIDPFCEYIAQNHIFSHNT